MPNPAPTLLALCLALPVFAQEPPPSDDTTPRGDTAAAAPAETGNRPVAAPPDLPPDDYEASEQISEDLSVSFPVDI